MSTRNRINRTQQIREDQELAGGLTKHAATISSLTLSGTARATTDLVALVLGRVASATAVAPARVAWQTVVKADQDERDRTDPVVSEIRQALKLMFAGQVDVLADFGLRPRRPPTPLTPEQKAAAVAKAKATREARHIMGPRQRAAIHAPAAPVAPAAPAAPPAAAPPAAAAATVKPQG